MDNSLNVRLKAIRKALKMSQISFAKRIGITQGTLSGIEGGRTGVTNKVASELQDEFKVNLAWLYTGQGEMFIGNTNILQGAIQGNDTGGITRLFEKQKIIAEKYFKNLSVENPEFGELRRAILIIQSFESLLHNIRDNRHINSLIKIEDSSRKYLNTSYSTFKDLIDADYRKIAKHRKSFLALAKAITLFAKQLSEVDEMIIDIDKNELKDFLDMND
jgi:transcriptional regulator with XRE-family HTH domain